jgi:hypothetical protein
MMPLQFSACFPSFLTHDFQTLHDPVEVEYGSGVDGQLVWRSKNTPMMRRDHAFYLKCVEEFSRGDLMLEVYYQLLAAKDEMRRSWWLMADTKLKVHRAPWQPAIGNGHHLQAALWYFEKFAYATLGRTSL